MLKQHGVTVIQGGRMILSESVVQGDLVLHEGRILDVIPGGVPHEWLERADALIDAEGMYVLPGMIDMHCDAVEKEVQPRPNTSFPLDQAFYELDKKLAVTGITTMYHSVSLADGVGVRDDEQCLNIISRFQGKGRRSMVRHRIHLRYEVTNLTGLSKVEQMIEEGLIDLLSYMDHTPGQGQFARPGTYEAYVEKTYGTSGEESRQLIGKLKESQQKVDWAALHKLAERAWDKGIALASHDDDSPAKVDFMMRCPLTISEFPVNLETAIYARQQGLHTVVGAPNIVRGSSHSSNMRAMDAVKAGAADMLCSDYHPPSMLPAVFRIVEEGIALPDAVRMVTLNPAAALGIAGEAGSLEAGKQADVLLVEMFGGYPLIRQTIVGGRTVYRSEYREDTVDAAIAEEAMEAIKATGAEIEVAAASGNEQAPMAPGREGVVLQ